MIQQHEFPVELRPVFLQDGTQVPRKQAVVRSDTNQPLSVVGHNYQLATHKEVLDAVSPYISKFGEPQREVFLEQDGARLVARYTFRNHTIEIPKVNDQIALRLFVINSYNGTSSIAFRMGALVLKCLNGMTTFRNAFDLKFKHLGQKKFLEVEGNEAFGLPDPELMLKDFKVGAETYGKWAETPLNDYTKKITVVEGFKLQVLTQRSYEAAEEQFVAAKTVWDQYNAHTWAITHAQRGRESGKLDRLNRLNRMFAHRFC